jgi:hypothetical protein
MRAWIGLAVLASTVGCNIGTGTGDPDTGDTGGNAVCAHGCTKIASARGAFRVAVDAQSAFFTHGNGVTRVDLAGGQPTSLVTGVAASALAIDENNVYYGVDGDHTNGQLYSVPKQGGTPTLLAQGQLTVDAILATGDALFWTTFGHYDASQADATFMRMDLASRAITTVKSGFYRGYGIQQTPDGTVYFLSCGSVTPGLDGAMWGVAPTAGAEPTAVLQAQPCPVFVVSVGTNVWVSENAGDGGHVIPIALPAGTPGEHPFFFTGGVLGLASDPSLASDSSAVFVSSGDSVVALTNLGTGAMEKIFEQGNPYGLAVDADHVYVADHDTGLWRVARR